jgi:hypothetical protein
MNVESILILGKPFYDFAIKDITLKQSVIIQFSSNYFKLY